MPAPTPADEFADLWSCLTDAEATTLRQIFESADSEIAARLETQLRQAQCTLPLVAGAIKACPTTEGSGEGAGSTLDRKQLVDALTQTDESGMEFVIPTGAILGRAFVQAKINFLKAFARIAKTSNAASSVSVGELVGDAVFTKIAEELLTATLANPLNDLELKRAAAARLVAMWDDRFKLPVETFPSVLVSAWRARRKVRAVFGTLVGVTEVLSLIKAGGQTESAFVNFFSRERVTNDEAQAFQEFLFGMPYEELIQVRKYMDENGLSVVSSDQVREILDAPVRPAFFGYPTPDEMYAAYRRRRTRAEYRSLTASVGPRKTAEGYLIEAILLREIGED